MWTAPVKNSYRDGSYSIGIGNERRTDETDFIFWRHLVGKEPGQALESRTCKVTWGRGFT